MGALSYKQKRLVIDHLADPAHWVRREIDMNWLDDPSRKQKQIRTGDIVIIPITDEHIILADDKSRGFMQMKRIGEEIHITDETGQLVTAHRTGKYFKGIRENDFSYFNSWKDFQKLPGRHVDLSVAGLSVLFQDDGGKKLFFHDSGGIANFAPTPESLRPDKGSAPLRALHQRHVVSFPDEMDGKALSADAAKLVIAFDLAIEPGLKTLNALSDPSQWRRKNGKLTRESIQQPWSDSAEFTGNYIAIPSNFSVAKTDEGFDVSTSRDFRDWVVGHAQIIHSVTQGDVQAERTNKLKLQFPDLSAGSTVTAMSNQDWRYGIYETPRAAGLAYNMRYILSQTMQIEGRDFLSVNYEPKRTLVAVNEQQFERTRAAYEATRDVVNAIEKGLPKSENALDFLRDKFAQGADPKYYYGERGAKTFADLMVTHGRRELERALIELQGTHEFGVIQNAPKNQIM